MKALILSGGYGTRLRPITYSMQKQLIPIANKPILFYTIEDVINAGADDIGIIVGPNKDQVMETVKSIDWDADIKFIHQGEPLGLAHTILIAESFLEDENFIMYLGDNILKGGIVKHARQFASQSPDSLILLAKVDEPERFGIAEFDGNGKIKRFIEKPKVPPSNFAIAGIYFFKPIIIDACKNIKPSWRNELEITDAIQWLMENDHAVEASKVNGWWKDTGRAEDILEANRIILDDIKKKIECTCDESRIIGRCMIGKGSHLCNSIVKGPCIIGDNCTISDTYIGPYTSIGNDCEVMESEVEDSIIMDKSRVNKVSKITESLIGKSVLIEERGSRPAGQRFILGDNSNVTM